MTNKEFVHLLNILDAEDTEVKSVSDFSDKTILEHAKNQCPIWSIDEACSVLGRQYKSTILTLFPLLYHIKRYVHNNLVYISQTDEHLLRAYSNNHERIWYLIRKVLIEKAKVLYDLNLRYEVHSVAKMYYVRTENLHTMLELFNRVHGVQPYFCLGDDSKALYIKDGYEYKLMSAYSLYPSLSLDSKLQIHEAYSFDEIRKILLQRYFYIPYYQHVVEIFNEKISRYDEKIDFDIKPKYSKRGKITKLKIRAFSNTCILKSWEKYKKKCELLGIDAVVDPNIKYREQYLKERFGEYEEYDVHASVPRVARAIKKGDMGDLDEDLYRTMFEPYTEDYRKCINPSVTEWCDEVRQFYKSIFMRLFFGGTPKQIVSNILYKEKKEAQKAHRQEVDIDILTPFSNIIRRGIDLVALVTKWQNAVYEYCGRSKSEMHDTSVFLHESCIYLEVRLELARRGIDVVQVYDGFYFKKGTMPSDMNEIIKASALKFCQNSYKYRQFNILKSISDELHSTTKEEYDRFIKKAIDAANNRNVSTEISLNDAVIHNVRYVKPK